MKATKKTTTAFSKVIKDKGLKRSWVANQLEISNSHLTNMLSGRSDIPAKHRDKLNAILQTNY